MIRKEMAHRKDRQSVLRLFRFDTWLAPQSKPRNFFQGGNKESGKQSGNVDPDESYKYKSEPFSSERPKQLRVPSA